MKYKEPTTLGERIKRGRLERGLTQKELARELGISEFTVINWENGKTEPPVKSMPVILQFLGCDPFL